MSKLIYLETDEEITDVIDKISKVDSDSVSLVIPRGSTLANSIVNLKLLVKRSKAFKKDVALVTNDNIAHNLASQIGLPVYESIEDAKAGNVEPESEIAKPKSTEKSAARVDDVGGVKVHQYDRDGSEDMEPIEAEAVAEVPIENDSEIIEAVRDADNSTTRMETQIDADEIQNSSINQDDSEGKNDFKLIKKPMEPEMRHRELSRHEEGSGQIFGRMRNAKSRRKMIIGIISGAAALLLVFGAYIALPKATVTLSVISEPFSSAADVKISKDANGIDASTSTIPGKLVTDEQELVKPFAASGTKNIGSKAKGKITIYNYWDDKPHDIAAGSKFTSSGGVSFVSTGAVTVPAGHANIIPPSTYEINPPGTVDVNVEAVDVGEQGNIGASNFTISGLSTVQQAKIYGKSTTAMASGTNQIVKIVSDKDISDAKASTENELKETITNKIKSGLGTSDKLLDSAILPTVSSESASAKAGDQVDTFNYSAKIKVDALTFSEDNFKTVLLETAKTKLAADKQLVTNNTESVKYDVASADVASGLITLKGTFDGFISGKYDADAMKMAIKFKSVTKATAKLTSYPGVLSADIVTSPKYLRSLPALAKRITINFNYGSTSSPQAGSTTLTTGSSTTTSGSGSQ